MRSISRAPAPADAARAAAASRMELRKRGVPDRHIDAAIAQVFADVDEAAMVRKVIERRTRAARGPSMRAPLTETLLTERRSRRCIARCFAPASIPA